MRIISLAKICWCLKSHLEYASLNSNPVKMYRMVHIWEIISCVIDFQIRRCLLQLQESARKKITWSVCLRKYHVVLFLQVESDSIGWSSPFNCLARLQISTATNTHWSRQKRFHLIQLKLQALQWQRSIWFPIYVNNKLNVENGNHYFSSKNRLGFSEKLWKKILLFCDLKKKIRMITWTDE